MVLADGAGALHPVRAHALQPAYQARSGDELIEVINAEASRRAGVTRDKSAAYEMEALIGSFAPRLDGTTEARSDQLQSLGLAISRLTRPVDSRLCLAAVVR